MDIKDELLAALKLPVTEAFTFIDNLLSNHFSKSHDLNLSETLEVLSTQQHEKLWKCIKEMLTLLLQSLAEDDCTEDKQQMYLSNLRRITDFILLYQSLKPRPPSLFASLEAIHELLMSLNDSIVGAVSLKRRIAEACEKWWCNNENSAENLISQLIPYLLLSSLDEEAKAVDVTRLYNMRAALLLLDFDDESIQTIQGLLLRCFADPRFLKSVDGRRFLSFVLCIHNGFHSLIVGVMKPQLCNASTSLANAYGDILYRTWKDGVDGNLVLDDTDPVALVEDTIQDLIHDAIHAANSKYFKSLRQLLRVFHEAKRVSGVDTMLLKVYGPIIWRSLRCANAIVRAHASSLFFDTFPLNSPDMSAGEADQLLQKQFDLLTALLKDGDHHVRAIAAAGVCHILRVYWELIPSKTIHTILSYIVGTLGLDMSAAEVRCGVITGITELLDCPLSHAVLKNLLPIVGNSLHDTSEKVRIAFIRLLCKVKQTRGMHFYDIVPLERICDQFDCDADRPAVCMAMTDLLLNSFYPRSGDSPLEGDALSAEQLKRCLTFVEHHERGAAVFYANLHHHSSVGSAMKLCVLLLSLTQNSMSSTQNTNAAAKKTKTKRRRAEPEDTTGDEELNISPATLHRAVLVIAACLRSIESKLNDGAYKLSRDMLQQYFTTPALQVLLLRANDCSSSDAALYKSVLNYVLEIVAIVSRVLSSTGKGKKKNAAVGSGISVQDILDMYTLSSSCSDQDFAKVSIEALCSLGVTNMQSFVTDFLTMYSSAFTNKVNKKSKSSLILAVTNKPKLMALLVALLESNHASVVTIKEYMLSDDVFDQLNVLLMSVRDELLAEFGEHGYVNTELEQTALSAMHIWTAVAAQRYNITSSLQPVFDTVMQILAAAMTYSAPEAPVKSAKTKTRRNPSSSANEIEESESVDASFIDALLEVMVSDMCDAAMCKIATAEIATSLSIASDMLLRAVQHNLSLPKTIAQIARMLSIIMESLCASEDAELFTLKNAYRNIFDNMMAIMECQPLSDDSGIALKNVFGVILGYTVRGTMEQIELSTELMNRALFVMISNMSYNENTSKDENGNNMSCTVNLPVAELFASVLSKKVNFSEPFAKHIIGLLRTRIVADDADADKASAALAYFRANSKLKVKSMLQQACREISDDVRRNKTSTPATSSKSKSRMSFPQGANGQDFSSVSLSLLA